MKKNLIIAAIAVISMMAMGLASRDLRPEVAHHAGVALHDAHLRYYEDIRPALVDGMNPWVALCRSDHPEARRMGGD